MKKLLRLFKKILLWGLLVFLLILIYNTITFSSKQIEVKPIKEVEISDRVISNLSKAIQIPTISYSGYVDTLAFLQLDSFITSTFVLVDSLLEKQKVNGISLVYQWKGKNPQLKPILLTGHMDVVPVEESGKKNWEQSPFAGVVDEEYIWGRGTLDDKLDVIGIMEAVEGLLAEEYIPERTIWFAFGHDEEINGEYGAKSIAKMFEENNISFEYALDEGSLILENALGGLDAPLAMIGVAEKGSTTLTLSVQLKEGGHSSMPPSETAIGILSEALAKLEDNPLPARIDGATQNLFDHVGPEMGFLYKILFSNLWCTKNLLINRLQKDGPSNAMIRTTTALTMIRGGIKENVLPTTASAKVNFRILPGDTYESVRDYVKNVIDDERVLVSVDKKLTSNPSKVSSADAYGFKVIQKTIKEVFPNVVVAPSLVIAATDGRHYKSVAENTYRFTPIQITKPDLKRIHGMNERLSISEYKRCIRFYRQLILNSCK